MADFMDAGNKMHVIIPSFFYNGFTKEFLNKTRKEVSEFANNPPTEFQKDIAYLDVVLNALTDFTTDTCQVAHWCPDDHEAKLKNALKRLV